jgi:hypothetical protein
MFYVCVGVARHRIPVRDGIVAEQFYDEVLHYMCDMQLLSLERDTGLYTPIYNEHELLLACRLAVDAHSDAMAVRLEDDGWQAETAQIWERMLLPDEDEDESVEAYVEPPAPVYVEPYVQAIVEPCEPVKAFLCRQQKPLFAPLPRRRRA